jgi:hypothetical protein
MTMTCSYLEQIAALEAEVESDPAAFTASAKGTPALTDRAV